MDYIASAILDTIANEGMLKVDDNFMVMDAGCLYEEDKLDELEYERTFDEIGLYSF